jgi:perosamine synthetase
MPKRTGERKGGFDPNRYVVTPLAEQPAREFVTHHHYSATWPAAKLRYALVDRWPAGRYAGTTATIGTFSTHTRKLLSTGEGGFCLTTDDALSTRLRELRNLGKPAGRAFGTRFGLNYKLNALAAALGRAQLGRLHDRLRHRRATLHTITDMITALPGMAPFPVHPDGQANGYAALLTTNGPARPVAERLAAAGVTSDPLRYHYRPLYHSPAFAQFTPTVACRHAEQLSETLVSIPSHEGVGPHDLDRIQAALRG